MSVQTLYVDGQHKLSTFMGARGVLSRVNHLHFDNGITGPRDLKRLLRYEWLEKISPGRLFYQPRRKNEWAELFDEVPEGRLTMLDPSTFVGEDHKTREDTLVLHATLGDGLARTVNG